MLISEQEQAKKIIESWLKEIQPDCEIGEWEIKKVEDYYKIKLRIEGKIKIIKISREDFDDVAKCDNWDTRYGREFKQKVKQKLKNQL